MRTSLRAAVAAALALATLALPRLGIAAEEPAGRVPKAVRAVEDHLARLQAGGAQVQAVRDATLPELFPGHVLVSARFRQYPVAFEPPKPLQSQNLFAVQPDGKLRPLTGAADLEAFFRTALPPVRDDATARAAARAWLRLSQELAQDGFFQFTTPDELIAASARGDGRQASGKSLVTGGGRGEIGVALTFDGAGRLEKAVETSRISPGVRPRCQATKLLDRDPVVRAMAEQDLMAMGRAAKEYLMAQRARAPRRRQQAIDRIWQRILKEGW